ncbi:uncharacterized protein LOC141685071 [Apium graveolens]|uniref:uncharacterized protein LOC141685071 n=1 Tax=Apium graveolens TaxID=4045 RepID=UPI003D7B2130
MGLKEWDIEVITDLFNERDQALILGTPLSSRQEEDIRYWHKEGNSHYSVESAFRLIQELQGAWVSSVNSGFCRSLWNLKIPPKVKNFLWRVCSGYLPTKIALKMKHVPVSVICPLCNRYEETTLHCLVKCGFTQWCFKEVGVVTNVDNSTIFVGWLEMLMGQHTNSMISRIGMLLWSIWKVRNMVVWQDTYLHVDEVVRTIHLTLDQWIEAQEFFFVPSVNGLHTMDGKELWTKPDQQTIKINLDAALFDADNSFGYGFNARDHTSRLIDARAVCQRGRTSAELAEAIAFKEALSWIKVKQ